MEEIAIKKTVNNGINYQPQLVLAGSVQSPRLDEPQLIPLPLLNPPTYRQVRIPPPPVGLVEHHLGGIMFGTNSMKIHKATQWVFLVPIKGGRWHIIPQLAVYTTYSPCLLAGYIIPTTYYQNLKNPLSYT